MGLPSSIAGEGPWESCWRHACYMSLHVYSDPPGDEGFSTAWPDKVSEVDAHWEEWDDLDQQGGNGLVARLFKAKNWNPEDPESPPCPPCLAFRGTDFHDMRGIAVAYRVEVYGHDVFNDVFPMDDSIAAGTTREQLIAQGYEALPIHNESGRVWVEGANFGIRAPVSVTLSLDILAATNGDWLSNLRQGLGRPSPQYIDARDFGRQTIDQKIMPLENKRLQITGHSLGGGLTAATAAFLDYQYPDVYTHGLTFNAAGVHPNTARPASTSDGNILNVAVEDEPLTTIQSQANLLPIVGAIFRMAEPTLGQRGMPEALGLTVPLPPAEAPSLRRLPNLWPIRAQTLNRGYRDGFPVVTAIDGLLAGSSSISNFGNRFMNWLNEAYRDRAIATVPRTLGVWTIWNLYREMFRHLLSDLEPEQAVLAELGLAAVGYHGMDTVIASYEKALRG